FFSDSFANARIIQLHAAGITSGFVGSEMNHHDPIGMAEKIFPRKTRAIDFITDMRQGIPYIKIPAVIGKIIMATQVDDQMTEHLVGSHGTIVTRGILITAPEAVLVQHQVLTGHSAADQRATPAIA